MASPAFAELVSKLVEAMGQRLTSIRQVPEGLLLQTTDGYVYAFVEDPDEVSLASLERLLGESASGPPRIVLLTPGRLPLALGTEMTRRGATVVDGARFHELVRSLGFETYLGEEPRPAPTGERSRLLPSAQQLDAIIGRARAWLEWGVPVLALRFYRQALDLKPGFTPARVGVARAFLALGLAGDAEREFDAVLAERPEDLGARMGKAAVLGARGRADEEIALYRELLRQDPARAEVQAHLVAALIDLPDWAGARDELRKMLRTSPEDPRLRYLYGITLARTGHGEGAQKEWRRARELGLSPEAEEALAGHAGWKTSTASHRAAEPKAGGPVDSGRGGGPARAEGPAERGRGRRRSPRRRGMRGKAEAAAGRRRKPK